MTALALVDDWRTQAECCQHDPELWFSAESQGSALHICHTHCPVRDQCEAWAHQVGDWLDTTVGGERWVWSKREQRRRPTKVDIPHTTTHCRTCRGELAEPLGEPRCGTLPAARRHRARGENMCDLCGPVFRDWDAIRQAGRRAQQARRAVA